MSMIKLKNKLITWLTSTKPNKVVHHDNGFPYLTRWYILRTRWLGIYLHYFHSPDQDRELHNHPWYWSFSFILRGSYKEVVQKGLNGREVREVKTNHFNFIGSKFHRIASVSDNLFTIFIRGPMKPGRSEDNWGFINHRGHFTTFKDFKK